MRPILLSFGSFHLYGYGTMIVLGLILPLRFLHGRMEKVGLKSGDDFWLLVNVLLVSGFAGGRILYLFEYTRPFSRDFWETLISPSRGFSLLGGFASVPLGVWLFCRWRGIEFLRLLDTIGVVTPFWLMIARFGCLLAGCCYGRPTGVPWAIRFTAPASQVPQGFPSGRRPTPGRPSPGPPPRLPPRAAIGPRGEPSPELPAEPPSSALVKVEPAQLSLLAPLVEKANAYAVASQAENTRRAFQGDWRAYQVWCSAMGLVDLPLNPSVVATYLTALAAAGRKPSTVARALSGIIHAHKTAGHRWEKGNPIVQKVLKGIRRTWSLAGGEIAQKTPIGIEHLTALLGALDDGWEGLRDRAIISLGWHGAFRRSEIVALNVEDLTFDPRGVAIRVRRSKTDQEGQGEYVGVFFSTNPALCPVLALRAHLDGATTGAIFCALSGRRLPAQAVAIIVQKTAKLAGLPPGFAAHSLRSGFATTAAGHGAGLAEIMKQGRWKDPKTALRYIRPATVFGLT